MSFPNLYVLAGAPSGGAKSITADPILRPLFHQQQEQLEHWKRSILPGSLAEKFKLEAERKRILSGKLEVNPSADRLVSIQERLQQLEESLQEPRIFVENATTEALVKHMAINHGVMASVSSDARELIGIVGGKYRKAGDTDEGIYLKAWSGEPYDSPRIGRLTTSMPATCLTCLWLTQLDKVQQMFRTDSFTEGGLLPRFLLLQADYPPQPVRRERGTIDPQIARAWDTRIRSLTATFRFCDTGFTNTLIWSDGQTNTQFVVVQTLDDNMADGGKTVNLSLLNPIGGPTLSYPSNAVLVIVDVEQQPGSLKFSSPTYSALKGISATITVNRVGGLAGPISALVTTSDGTGTTGVNYIGVTNGLTWADGETNAKSIAVRTLDDNTTHGNKTVNLSLLNPNGGAGLSYPSNAVLTIYGDVHFVAPNFVLGVGLQLQSTGGMTGANAVLQYATNLCTPLTWTALITNAADSDGNWTYTITNLSYPAQFFRLVPTPQTQSLAKKR